MELQQVAMKKSDDPELQLELFNQAMLQVQMDLDAMALRFRESVSQDSMAIFEIYQHLLSDPAYLQQIEEGNSRNIGVPLRQCGAPANASLSSLPP